MEAVEGVGLPPGTRVLDVGCGAGVFAVWMASRAHIGVGVRTVDCCLVRPFEDLEDQGTARSPFFACEDFRLAVSDEVQAAQDGPVTVDEL